jgi:anti-sigma B factor antagonist
MSESIATEATRLADGTRVLSVAGTVDIATVGELERLLAAEATGLIVDLTDCEFVDSSATAPLVRAHNGLPAESKPLALVSEQARVLRVFEITGLDRLFAIYPTRAAALRGGGHVGLA